MSATRLTTAWILVIALMLNGCRPGAFLVPTVVPTATFTAIPSLTPSPTLSPTPTLTPSPTLTPTLVPAVGTPDSNGNWEVTVLEGAVSRPTLFFFGIYEYPTDKRNIFVDMAVRIRNLNPAQNRPISLASFWVVDETGTVSNVSALGIQPANPNKSIDPFSIGITRNPYYDPNKFTALLQNDDIYMRVIFIVSKSSLSHPLQFHFQSVIVIPFSVN